MQSKEYHLFLYFPIHFIPLDFTCDDVNTSIKNGEPIYTFQVITCTTELFRHGYRVFVHAAPDDEYEIKLGMNERTGREIKMGHCLYKMILAGEFEKDGAE